GRADLDEVRCQQFEQPGAVVAAGLGLQLPLEPHDQVQLAAVSLFGHAGDCCRDVPDNGTTLPGAVTPGYPVRDVHLRGRCRCTARSWASRSSVRACPVVVSPGFTIAIQPP